MYVQLLDVWESTEILKAADDSGEMVGWRSFDII